MGSINISIRKEAYDFLKSLKSGDKSFSDVILEFKGEKGSKENIMKFFGILKHKEDWNEMEGNISEFREEFDERIEGITDYMQKARNKSRGNK